MQAKESPEVPDKSDLQTQAKESPEGISGPTFKDCFIYDKK